MHDLKFFRLRRPIFNIYYNVIECHDYGKYGISCIGMCYNNCAGGVITGLCWNCWNNFVLELLKLLEKFYWEIFFSPEKKFIQYFY